MAIDLFGSRGFLGQAYLGIVPLPSKGPPSESNPELAGKPYASTVDELCQLGRKQAKDFAGPSYADRIIKVIRNAKENEDAVLADLKKYCPEGSNGIFAALRELGERRRLGLLPRKPVQTGVPTSTPTVSEEDALFAPSSPRTAPPSYPLTPTPGSPYGRTPEGNIIFAPRPQRTAPPSYPLTPTPGSTPTASLPTYLDVQTQGLRAPSYGTDLQRQIDSYTRSLQEFSSRPRPYTDIYNTQPVATPSAMRPTPSSTQTSGVPGECPPGQFVDPRYPERGCQPLGGMPMPTGGFSSADVATGMMTSPGVTYGTMGRSFRVMNVG